MKKKLIIGFIISIIILLIIGYFNNDENDVTAVASDNTITNTNAMVDKAIEHATEPMQKTVAATTLAEGKLDQAMPVTKIENATNKINISKPDHTDAYEQYLLGNQYHLGRGVVKNEEEAVKWYRKAAEQGNADAKAALEK